MNKNAIKEYAIWARRELIDRVSQKAFEYGIEKEQIEDVRSDTVKGVVLSQREKSSRLKLISEIKAKGIDQVMEEVAYTWFNRFIALRFMEVNNYLPQRVRPFTDEENKFNPQILDEASDLDFVDQNEVYSFKINNDTDGLYKYLLIALCNDMNQYLPGMFETIDDYKVLLFPDNLLREGSVISRMVSDIDLSDWEDEVEIIGWIYQYYITEKHEEVVDPLHGKTVKKEDIPAATQLFTTDWIVRYILDNSLGRYWLERHPESKLASKLKYYVEPKEGLSRVEGDFIQPEELRVLDPCVGSGHFLTYAFDILLEIYRESGWTDRDAAKSIVEYNLYGLDIDDRAAQLAYFALLMKARKYNRRILNHDQTVHVLSIQESDFISDDLVKYVSGTDISIRDDLLDLRQAFNNAKEYGSIIKVLNTSFAKLRERVNAIQNKDIENLQEFEYQNLVVEKLLPLVLQAEVFGMKYDVVATNPPYMNRYSAKLKSFIESNYKDYKGDLFSVFVYRNFDFCKVNGYSGFMTPMVWMFIKTYEQLRQYILSQKSITTLTQYEYSAYEEATVPICSFVLQNKRNSEKGCYFRLSDFTGGMEVQRKKVEEAINNKNCGYYYDADQKNFAKIPGSPIAYWASTNVINCFSSYKSLKNHVDAVKGLDTCDNDTFTKVWFEPSINDIGFNATSTDDTYKNKWYPYCKGGDFRRWYGNNNYVVNWENDGQVLRNLRNENGKIKSRPQNIRYYFKTGLTWSTISSYKISMRYMEKSIFGGGGSGMFTSNNLKAIQGFMNSNVALYFLNIINPTLNILVGDILSLPLEIQDNKNNNVETLVDCCINLSKQDWDSFETSWGFRRHPLVVDPRLRKDQLSLGFNSKARHDDVSLVSKRYERWERECLDRFNQLKANEEELNRIFIDIYGLQNELTPEVEERDVTIRKANLQREVKSLMSYAVGCMFGRYSLDTDGLAYAGGKWNKDQYITYIPDEDNIIPISDDEYFEDDIVSKFISFIKIAYGEDTLGDNLQYISDALGGNGTPREIIRNYFVNDFFKDHCDTYQVTGSGKRPIYWQFDSGKKNGFKALIYMHRYTPDLLAKMRTDYVHEQQERYRTQIENLETEIINMNGTEKIKANKLLAKYKDQLTEISVFEEKLHHLADQMISIDLDDGFKQNYPKFEGVVTKVK